VATAQTATPVVKETRPTPVVPIPAPAPVLRPSTAKPTVVPTIRGGETTPPVRSAPNGAVDPVTRWLIGGEDAGDEQSPQAAQSEPAQPRTSASNARWEWSSELGQWVEVTDSRGDPADGGEAHAEDGDR
jgi:hypothetical protein